MKSIFLNTFLILMTTVFGIVFWDRNGHCDTVYTPIESISLSYNSSTQSLHVQAHHPSVNPLVEYVRMMTVAVNGAQSISNNYDHQNGQDFSDDVTVNAQAGDTVSVDLFCTGGMSKSLDLTVTNAQTSTANWSSDDTGNAAS